MIEIVREREMCLEKTIKRENERKDSVRDELLVTNKDSNLSVVRDFKLGNYSIRSCVVGNL